MYILLLLLNKPEYIVSRIYCIKYSIPKLVAERVTKKYISH